MPTKQYKPKTPAEMQQASREKWDWQQQQQASFEQERAARQAEDAAFMQRVQASREARAAALERGEELPPVAIPTFEAIMAEKRAAEKAAAAEAEALRISQLSKRDIWMSTLSWKEQEKVRRWQALNPGLEYPMPEMAK